MKTLSVTADDRQPIPCESRAEAEEWLARLNRIGAQNARIVETPVGELGCGCPACSGGYVDDDA